KMQGRCGRVNRKDQGTNGTKDNNKWYKRCGPFHQQGASGGPHFAPPLEALRCGDCYWIAFGCNSCHCRCCQCQCASRYIATSTVASVAIYIGHCAPHFGTVTLFEKDSWQETSRFAFGASCGVCSDVFALCCLCRIRWCKARAETKGELSYP